MSKILFWFFIDLGYIGANTWLVWSKFGSTIGVLVFGLLINITIAVNKLTAMSSSAKEQLEVSKATNRAINKLSESLDNHCCGCPSAQEEHPELFPCPSA